MSSEEETEQTRYQGVQEEDEWVLAAFCTCTMEENDLKEFKGRLLTQ